MHGPYNILPADRTFIHPFATLRAGHHVSTLKKNTINCSIHTDPAQVVIMEHQRSLFTVCKEEMHRQLLKAANNIINCALKRQLNISNIYGWVSPYFYDNPQVIISKRLQANRWTQSHNNTPTFNVFCLAIVMRTESHDPHYINQNKHFLGGGPKIAGTNESM